jgi:amino acid transporter
MALINCPECEAEVSDTALKCQKCGLQLRKAKRGFFGFIFKWTFILFNLLMILWLFTGIDAVTENMDMMSEAEKTGTAIGAGIGAMMILSLWVVGDIILGLFVLFTRPKS